MRSFIWHISILNALKTSYIQEQVTLKLALTSAMAERQNKLYRGTHSWFGTEKFCIRAANNISLYI